jgi:hypothetical protein
MTGEQLQMPGGKYKTIPIACKKIQKKVDSLKKI